jgi:hypothetical protein
MTASPFRARDSTLPRFSSAPHVRKPCCLKDAAKASGMSSGPPLRAGGRGPVIRRESPSWDPYVLDVPYAPSSSRPICSPIRETCRHITGNSRIG